jgi:hypothetical protein
MNVLNAAAEAVFGTADLRVYASELWAKYSGAAGYEQEHHRDYLNHTPLVPSASDLRWRGLEMFIRLGDVPEDHGPTHIVPLPVTAGVPALPHGYLRAERPDFYHHEQSGAGPAVTPGETTHFTPTGRHSSSKPPCASFCSSASRRRATPTGPRKPSAS